METWMYANEGHEWYRHARQRIRAKNKKDTFNFLSSNVTIELNVGSLFSPSFLYYYNSNNKLDPSLREFFSP
jgi:hypothetical protein